MKLLMSKVKFVMQRGNRYRQAAIDPGRVHGRRHCDRSPRKRSSSAATAAVCGAPPRNQHDRLPGSAGNRRHLRCQALRHRLHRQVMQGCESRNRCDALRCQVMRGCIFQQSWSQIRSTTTGGILLICWCTSCYSSNSQYLWHIEGNRNPCGGLVGTFYLPDFLKP